MYYIIGSEGFLGKKIKTVLKKKKIMLITTKKKKNIFQTKLFSQSRRNCTKFDEKWIKKIKNDDIIILLSSAGKVDFLEKNPKKITSFANSLEKNFFLKVNRNAKIIFLSSDMVYSGKRSLYLDNSKTLPQNNYGKSKKVVEELTKKYFNNYLILRLSKIFSVSSNDKTMYSEIINSIKKKKYLRLFNNQYVHYLDLRDFLNCFKKLISKINKLKGTFNFPGRKYTTRYKFAMEIIKKKRLDTKYLIPINVQDKKIRIPLKIKMRTNLFHKVNFVHKY